MPLPAGFPGCLGRDRPRLVVMKSKCPGRMDSSESPAEWRRALLKLTRVPTRSERRSTEVLLSVHQAGAPVGFQVIAFFFNVADIHSMLE